MNTAHAKSATIQDTLGHSSDIAFRQHEQRSSIRTRTLLRVAHFTTASADGLCRVQNISDEGMLLVSGLQVAQGDDVRVTLSDVVSLRGAVIWADGTKMGVRFREAIDSAGLLRSLAEERLRGEQRSPRLPVDTVGVAASELGLQAIRVVNISQRGMKIAHNGSYRRGMVISVKLESGIKTRGVVRWSDGSLAGLLLLEPLAVDRLENASTL